MTAVALPACAQSPLKVVYPPNDHQTTADRIFFIGTAPAGSGLTINGQTIGDRSPSGHFAPSLPLQMGVNTFTFNAGAETLTLTVTRIASGPKPPVGLTFGEGSLMPVVNATRLPNESICFGAIAPPNAQVAVKIGSQTIPLRPQPETVTLPPNSAVLTGANQPDVQEQVSRFRGCTQFSTPGPLGQPSYELKQGRQRVRQTAPGQLTILDPKDLNVVRVITDQGVARTGASTDYSRLTPLPKGVQSTVTGSEGEWLRLDYGAWIKASETEPLANEILPQSTIRSVKVETLADETRFLFPLERSVPVSVQQSDGSFTLSLYNTTAQTDTIFQTPGPVLSRLDWQQVAPTQVQYQLQLQHHQQWGYRLNYVGNTLVLALRHPPQLAGTNILKYGNFINTGAVVQDPLKGATILLDPGHGSVNDLGAVGPTGYPEKDVTLVLSKQLRQALEQRGAKVVMTREGDDDLYPQDRVDVIEKVEPTLALSIHYNALPDNGDAWNKQGVSTFWYHPQAQSLAVALHDHLTQQLGRPSDGVYWNNLALTRPAIAPVVLIELGFMINPNEFEWITDAKAQQELATNLADGIATWLLQQSSQ